MYLQRVVNFCFCATTVFIRAFERTEMRWLAVSQNENVSCLPVKIILFVSSASKLCKIE